MKKTTLLQRSTNVSDLEFDDMYYELSHNWQDKAKALQVRRWRKLKHAVKHSPYAHAR